MWAEYSNYKNHFLQRELKHLTTANINKIVSKELDNMRIEYRSHDVEHDSNSTCKNGQYFENRSRLAYGLWALPKLMQEMGSDNAEIQYRAINSLSEYVVNPLHAQRAITEFEIVRRCQNIFLRLRMKYQKTKYREVERLLVIFYYIAKHMNGVYDIVSRNRLMDQFYAIIRDREVHMLNSSRILSLLTEQTNATLYLIHTYKVIEKLYDIWQLDVCIDYYPPDLWLHLQHVLAQAPHRAVEKGFFEILHKRIKGRLSQFHRYDLKCFALLLRCEEGQKRFIVIDGVKEMYEILKDSSNKLDTYENVVETLMNGIIAKPILWRCREFIDLPLIVTQFARDSSNSNMQLFCLQLLRELGVMPCIKRYIRANCLEHLEELICMTDANKEKHCELMCWLQREIYHCSDLMKHLKTGSSQKN